ncbi:MAG: hypothetical protein KJO11_05090 [Gemmatimonadetes bacterium]|nr:hypothetical protein [Gemmatimonadota bacterium]MBT8404905.1 hypothetical protein [Gemmatimonadota bacterium]NNK62703.1 hypothetical protein [Gemmatimonadota bacterium]
MSEPVYVSRSRVRKVAGVTRHAVLEDGTEVTFGVHGPIKSAYGLDAEPDHPLPVDFLVAAACA